MLRAVIFVCGVLFLISASTIDAHARTLSDTEKKLVEIVDANIDDQVNFLETVVNMNSGTLNVKGVRKVGDAFKKELDAIGMDTRWVEMPPEMKRAGHVFASTTGKTGKRLLLVAHMDTVFGLESSFQKFKREGDVAWGPGVNDDKGGIVVMIYALKALQAVGALADTRINIALIGDEEDSGKPFEATRGEMIRIAKQTDVALGFEYAVDTIDQATVARRGRSEWTLKVTANTGHSSLIFSEKHGYGAVFGASDILSKFAKKLSKEKYLTFNPGYIVGGTKLKPGAVKSEHVVQGKMGAIASLAEVQGDLRYINIKQRERAKKSMRRIVQRTLPGTEAQIVFKDGKPPMPPSKGNLSVLKILSEVSQDLGYPKVTPLDPGKRGVADTCLIAQYADTIDGLGMLGNGAHTEKEKIDLTVLPKITARSALLIYRLTRATKN